MTGEIGAAGDLATGMLFARAVEPRAGEAAHGLHAALAPHPAQGLCLNCGTALRGDYCHACGQAGHVHRTLVSIGHDLLHGVFHFEGKVWRTLPMLVTHPGALTRRYIDGERARFVSPLALFLFSVFLMFALLHSNGDLALPKMNDRQRSVAVAKIDGKIAEAKRDLVATQRSAKPGSPELTKRQTALAALRSARQSVENGRYGISHKDSGWGAIDRGVEKAMANPGLMIYKLQTSAYKYSWVLIPISVPFVALMFAWRRQFKLYDHAIFVTYSLAFMMFLVVAMTVGGMIGVAAPVVAGLLCVVPPVHMFFQLRGAYSLRKRSALWRTGVLLVFAWTALAVFIALLLVMGLMD